MGEPLFEKKLDDLLPAASASEARPASRFTFGGGQRGAERLLAIARFQRWLILVILLELLVTAGAAVIFSLFGPLEPEFELPSVVGFSIAVVVLNIAKLIVMIRLASHVFSTAGTVITVVGAMLPFLSVVVMLILNGQATGMLKQGGVRVGLLGARSSDLKKLRD